MKSCLALTSTLCADYVLQVHGVVNTQRTAVMEGEIWQGPYPTVAPPGVQIIGNELPKPDLPPSYEEVQKMPSMYPIQRQNIATYQ